MKRRILSITLCIALLMVLAVPAFAVTRSASNESRTVYHNNKAYTGTAALSYTNDNKGYTYARLVDRDTGKYTAFIDVYFSGVTVKFNTQSHGYITRYGSAVTQKFSSNLQTLQSNKTSCEYLVVGYEYMNASVTFKGDSEVTISLYMS